MLQALTVAAAVALTAAASAGAGGSATAFVALPGRDRVVALDVGTGAQLRRISVAGGPERVAAYHDASRRRDFVLVTSAGGGSVTLIAAFTQRIVRVWRGFGRPADVVVDALRAYVVDRDRGALVVIDLRARRILARIAVGARPSAVAVGDLAVVAHAGRASLTLVDPARSRVVGSLPVHRPVASLSKQPDTANVYVAFEGTGELALIDWGRRRTVFRRSIGERLAQVRVDSFHGRRVWATDFARGGVVLASTQDGRVLRRLGGCPGASGIAQVGTASVVATCAGARSLAVWDATRWRLRRFGVGGRPAGVAVAVLP